VGIWGWEAPGLWFSSAQSLFSQATLAGDVEEGPREAPSHLQPLSRDRKQNLPRLAVGSLGPRGVGSDRGALSEAGRCCKVNSSPFSKASFFGLSVQVLPVIELLNPQRLGSPTSLPQTRPPGPCVPPWWPLRLPCFSPALPMAQT